MNSIEIENLYFSWLDNKFLDVSVVNLTYCGDLVAVIIIHILIVSETSSWISEIFRELKNQAYANY